MKIIIKIFNYKFKNERLIFVSCRFSVIKTTVKIFNSYFKLYKFTWNKTIYFQTPKYYHAIWGLKKIIIDNKETNNKQQHRITN